MKTFLFLFTKTADHIFAFSGQTKPPTEKLHNSNVVQLDERIILVYSKSKIGQFLVKR